MEQKKKEREDLETPHNCHAGYTLSNFGTDLDAIEPFTTELTEIVDKMKEELANEVRILEGTEVPEYKQNELSEGETKEGQWTTDLQNGFLTTVLTRTLTPELNSSSSSVRNNSPDWGIPDFVGNSYLGWTPSCPAIWVDCGSVIDATNESSECTVPMISEPMPGTPSEVK